MKNTTPLQEDPGDPCEIDFSSNFHKIRIKKYYFQTIFL